MLWIIVLILAILGIVFLVNKSKESFKIITFMKKTVTTTPMKKTVTTTPMKKPVTTPIQKLPLHPYQKNDFLSKNAEMYGKSKIVA